MSDEFASTSYNLDLKMISRVLAAFGFLRLAECLLATPWEAIIVMNVLRRDVKGSNQNLLSLIHREADWITEAQVESIRGSLESLARVPSWFHEALIDYGRLRGLNTVEPGLYDWIVNLAKSDSSYTIPSLKELKLRVDLWMTFCVRPLASHPGEVCGPDGDSHWKLTEDQIVQLIEMIMMFEFDIRFDQSRMNELITAEIRQDIRGTAQQHIARRFHVEVTTVQKLRTEILAPFVQPEWLLDELIGFPGELSATNSELRQILDRKARETMEPLNGKRIKKALEIWIELCANPIRTARALRTGIAPELPYIRYYPVVDGRELDLVVIRPELIQKYLASHDI